MSRRLRRDFGDDELMDPRANARALLESGEPMDEETVDGRALRRAERFDTGAEEEFSDDELDRADSVSSQMPNADGLAQKVAVRRDKWTDLNSIAKFTRINPPSALHGTLGGQQQLTVRIVGANQQPNTAQVALWGGVDAETIPVTVVLAPVGFLESPILFPAPIRPYAIVQFGTRGFLVKAEVDICQGVQFTLGASEVSLQVALEDVPNIYASFPTIPLAGMLSFYTTQKNTQITRTKYIDNLGATSDTGSILVPPFARNVTFWRDPVTSPIRLDFRGSDGVTLYSKIIAASTELVDPVPLSGDVAAIDVLTTGAGINFGRLIFGLSF